MRRPCVAARTSFIAVPSRLPTMPRIDDQHLARRTPTDRRRRRLLDVRFVGDHLAERREHRMVRMRDGQAAQRQAVAQVLRRADRRARPNRPRAREIHALDQGSIDGERRRRPANPGDGRCAVDKRPVDVSRSGTAGTAPSRAADGDQHRVERVVGRLLVGVLLRLPEALARYGGCTSC